jgi:hypothetical protein
MKVVDLAQVREIPKIEEITRMVFVEEMQTEHPAWIVERAKKLAERRRCTVQRALHIVQRMVEAERNAEYAGPDEPVRVKASEESRFWFN